MPVRTPEPRLPLEPEEYPLYRPPSRVGCSGLSIVALLSILVFGILFWSVTPGIVRGITSFNPFASGDETTETAEAGAGALETQTVEAAIPTVGVITTPTPVRHCVRVAGTGGEGTALRAQALTNAARIVPGTVGEGATLEIIGPDVPSGKNQDGSDIIWKNVKLLPPDNRAGFMLARFVQDVPCP